MEADDSGRLDHRPATRQAAPAPASRATRWVERLLDARWWLLSIGVVLAAISYRPAQRIEFNRSIENMFAANDPIVPPYRQLKETFGGNEIVLCVVRIPDLLASDGSGLKRLAELGDKLRTVPGIRDVLTLDRPIGPAIVGSDGLATRLRDVFAGYTHSTDGRMAAAVCLLEPEEPIGRRGGETPAARPRSPLGSTHDPSPADDPSSPSQSRGRQPPSRVATIAGLRAATVS